jgi:hypothetical protein
MSQYDWRESGISVDRIFNGDPSFAHHEPMERVQGPSGSFSNKAFAIIAKQYNNKALPKFRLKTTADKVPRRIFQRPHGSCGPFGASLSRSPPLAILFISHLTGSYC